jgi:hypothetical protein
MCFLLEGSIFVNQKIWSSGFIEEMREWNFQTGKNDDGLDAVAGCLLSEPVRIASRPASDAKINNWHRGAQIFSAQTKFNL